LAGGGDEQVGVDAIQKRTSDLNDDRFRGRGKMKIKESIGTKIMSICIAWIVFIIGMIADLYAIPNQNFKLVLLIGLLFAAVGYTVFRLLDYINYYGKPKFIIMKNRKLRLAIENYKNHEFMQQGWGAVLQKVIDEIMKTNPKKFKNDTEEILKLASFLDKSGPGKDNFDVYCRPNFDEFRINTGKLLNLLHRQLGN
jgi:hypothetical protein